MAEKHYKLRILPLFEDDLNEIVDYISIHLQTQSPQKISLMRLKRRFTSGFPVQKHLNLIHLLKSAGTHTIVFL